MYSGQNELSADEKASIKEMLPSLMIFAVVWSVGASCDKAGRKMFDKFVREQVRMASASCAAVVQ